MREAGGLPASEKKKTPLMMRKGCEEEMTRKLSALWHVRQYTILATTCGEVYGESGLGLHCEIDFWVTGISGGRRWDVDHLASGRRISTFNAQERARLFIEEIAPYVDWTQSYEVLAEMADLKEKVIKAAALAREWKPEAARKLLELHRQAQFWNEDDVI